MSAERRKQMLHDRWYKSARMSRTLLLDLPCAGNSYAIEFGARTHNAVVASPNLRAFSDSVLGAWLDDRVRIDDAAAHLFYARFPEALQQTFGFRFVRLRTSHVGRSRTIR